MKQGNLFGDPDLIAPVVMVRGKKKRSSTKPNGYADRPGTGPPGETCRSCRHRKENENRTARTYWKCGLMRHVWTGGAGTDIKAGSPACSKWEGKEK